MQHKASFSWRNFNAVPIIGIVRGMDVKTVMEIAQTYTKAGFSSLEVTMNTKDVQTIIGKLRTQFPDLNVGAGTVCTLKDFKLARLAGAQFIVTPIMQEEVIKRSVEEEIPIFPGAYTPTEIYKAWSLGASAVKIFPAKQLGPQFIKDMLSPLDSVKLLPTGGVSKENIRSYFEAGAFGVGMGSSLFDKELLKMGDIAGLEDHFRAIKAEIQEFRRSHS